MDLADMPIEPIARGDASLSQEQARELIEQAPGWTLGPASIERQLKFADFRAAMAFVNQVADEAEAAAHHPDIAVSYNRVKLVLSTHKVGGLSRNDFILAARIDRHVAG